MGVRVADNLYGKYGIPSLDLVFTQSNNRLKNIAGDGSIEVEFTRNTTGTYVGSDGLIKTAAIDAPRFDHDPVTGESLGLLIEESRTNLITQSNSLSSFSYTSHTLTLNDTTSPDGTVNASKVTSGGAGTAYKFTTTSLASTFSMYCKADSVDWVKVSISGSADTWFDLQSGVVGNGSGTIQTLANGWVRISVSTTQTGSIQTQFFPTIANGSFDRSSGNSMFVWGAQLEEGSFPTSYIPTDGTPGGIIRAADVASMTGTNFSSWYNQSEGSFVASARSRFDQHPNLTSRIIFDEPNTRLAATLYKNNTNLQYQFTGQVADIPSFSRITKSGQDSIKMAGSYGNSQTTSLAVDGNSNSTDTTTSTVYSVNSLLLGYRNPNTFYLNGHISRLTYWPKRLSDSDLQRLTK